MADLMNSTHHQLQAHPVYYRATVNVEGDFSDNRVFLVPPGELDKDPTSCVARQDWDGPTFITIGPSATDSALSKVSERYGIPIADLREFRANLSA